MKQSNFLLHFRNSFLLLKKMKWKILFPILIDVISFFVFSIIVYYLQMQILEQFEKLLSIQQQLETSVSQNSLAFALTLATTMQQHLNELLLTLAMMIGAVFLVWILSQPFSWLLLAKMKSKFGIFDYFKHFSFLTLLSSAISFVVFWIVVNYVAENPNSIWVKPFVVTFSIIISYFTLVGYALLPQKSFKELLFRIPREAIEKETISTMFSLSAIGALSYFVLTILYASQPRVALIMGFFWVFLFWSWARMYLIEVLKD